MCRSDSSRCCFCWFTHIVSYYLLCLRILQMCVNSYTVKIYLWQLRPRWKCVPLQKISHACFCQAVRALQTQNYFKFGSWDFFDAHVWDIISKWAQPQIGDGYPPCLFLLVAFFQFSHFSSSASGNPSFMYFQSKLPALLHSTPILCTLLSHQGLADVTRQTPIPAGILLELSFLLLSDNFPSFSDIAMSLKRKMLFVFHPAF